jgi:hypothetical protein
MSPFGIAIRATHNRKGETMNILKRSLVAVGLILSLGGIAHADYKGNLDWCIGNHTVDPGMTDCPDQYAATYPKCLTEGGRACLMGKAIQSAKDSDCSNAFKLSKICQCHNGGAQTEIANAGQQAVCDYLKTK